MSETITPPPFIPSTPVPQTKTHSLWELIIGPGGALDEVALFFIISQIVFIFGIMVNTFAVAPWHFPAEVYFGGESSLIATYTAVGIGVRGRMSQN